MAQRRHDENADDDDANDDEDDEDDEDDYDDDGPQHSPAAPNEWPEDGMTKMQMTMMFVMDDYASQSSSSP